MPSQFAHELLNANPYAFLDEAGLEERRARAVSLKMGIPASVLDQPGKLDPEAIETVRSECWPDIRDHHELHDLLMSLVILPVSMTEQDRAQHWAAFYERLVSDGRANTFQQEALQCWFASERQTLVQALWSGSADDKGARDEALRKCVQGWIQILGPVTASQFARDLSLDASSVYQQFVVLESQGLVMRGTFEYPPAIAEVDIEWCERRILQRIHKLSIGTRRKQVDPVSPAAFMRWLLGWQHLAPQTQLTGEEGLLEVLTKLEGFEAPAIEWEKAILPARVADYDPRWLDRLCLSGAVAWGRVSPHPAFNAVNGDGPRRVIPTNAAPITFYLRDSAAWLNLALKDQGVEAAKLRQALTSNALKTWELLSEKGACFAEDAQRLLGLSSIETQYALWELAAAGLAAADGFDQLRAMIDPGRRAQGNLSYRKQRSAAGRWSLFTRNFPNPADALEQARFEDEAVESAARMLLSRYGVVFRDLVASETNIPRWGLLLRMFRRLEDRGEVRGGRFVSGFGGEQFALPHVVDSLRAANSRQDHHTVMIAGADPMNLIGALVPGERVHAVPGRSFAFSTEEIEKSSLPTPMTSRPVRQRTYAARSTTEKPAYQSRQVGLFGAD